MAVTPSLKELVNILKPMSWKKRIDYLWTYYKLVLAAAIVVLLLISVVVTCIQNLQIQTLYSGVFLGTNLSQENREEIQNDLTELFGADGEKQIVKLIDISYFPGDSIGNIEVNSAGATKVTLMAASQSLDFILTNASVYEEVLKYAQYADLRDILSSDQQQRLKNSFVWTEEIEAVPSYPMALDISDTAFAKSLAPSEKELYLVFVGNTENGERNQPFLEYILNSNE